MKRSILWLPLVALLALVPVPASAVTVDQVVALAHAGVTDVVILALIDRDRTIFSIEPEQIVTLQRDGLSEAVILAMLKSGREEGERAARADVASNAARIAAAIAPAPELVIVGHGPEGPIRPSHGFYSSSPPPAYAPVPYATTFSRAFTSPRRSLTPSPSYDTHRFDHRFDEPRQLCLAQMTPRSGGSLSFVTECPAVMQRRRLR